MLVPAFEPLTFHCQAGVVPPWADVAVKETEVPAQTGFAEGSTDTLAVKTGLTIIVTELEVAGDPAMHGVASMVSTQVMTSLLAGE